MLGIRFDSLGWAERACLRRAKDHQQGRREPLHLWEPRTSAAVRILTPESTYPALVCITPISGCVRPASTCHEQHAVQNVHLTTIVRRDGGHLVGAGGGVGELDVERRLGLLQPVHRGRQRLNRR
jgi:hypothetical protein